MKRGLFRGLVYLLPFIASCSSSKERNSIVKSGVDYYVCTVDTVITLYKDPYTNTLLATIPANRQIIAKDRNTPYRSVIYGDYHGYIKHRIFKTEKAFDTVDLSRYVYNPDFTYTYIPWPSYSKRKKSSTSESSSSGGSVKVKGYYRKNGTYVSPHTRSAPRSRKY